MLSIKNVTKTFGDVTALDNISFDIDEGEFVFITGPSGSGKTTLIKLMFRELLPDEGEIIFEDQNITQLKRKQIPKIRQQFGVVFQDFKILPEKTLKENVELALAVVGLPQSEWKSRVDHVLGLVGLGDQKDLFPSQLSGGEIQRASLARALVVNPKVIIADEPTGNLDWDTADAIMQLFKKINEEGKTIIVATHHELIVDKYAPRVIAIDKGKLVKDTGKKEKEKKIVQKEKPEGKKGKGKSD